MPFAATTGLTDDDIARYFSEEGIRLWAPWQSVIVPGKATGQHEVVSDRDFERLDVYNEIIKPTKGFHAGFAQQDRPGLCFHAAICRRRRAGPFDAGELQFIQRLLPHLTTALELQKRLGASEQNSHSFGKLLDRLQEGAVITDRWAARDSSTRGRCTFSVRLTDFSLRPQGCGRGRRPPRDNSYPRLRSLRPGRRKASGFI